MSEEKIKLVSRFLDWYLWVRHFQLVNPNRDLIVLRLDGCSLPCYSFLEALEHYTDRRVYRDTWRPETLIRGES